jgi:hypothetical protein
MRIAGLALAQFSIAFFVHWLLWRIRVPRRQTAALLAILLGMLPVGLAAMSWGPGARLAGPLGPWQCTHIAVFHVALSLAYVVAYSALEEQSPSMTLLLDVARAEPEGRTRDELAALLEGRSPVEVRLDAMLRDKMVTQAGGNYQLTAKGLLWAGTFSCWLRLLKMDKGG